MSEARAKSRPQVMQKERDLEARSVPAVDELELFSGCRLLVEAEYGDGVVGAKGGPIS